MGRVNTRYAKALAHNDLVKWPAPSVDAAMGITSEGRFIRAAYSRALQPSIVVSVKGGERYIKIAKLIRCCCKCGCTEFDACDGGCSWIDVKTCSSCATVAEAAA